MIRLAKQYGRYGYRKVGELLRAEGWAVNHKKVERIWREEGLQLPQRHKRRKRLYHHDASIIRLRPLYPNHIWSIDFVHDRLSNGRPYKMLTVLDEYTREALCVNVATRMGSAEVLEALYPLLLSRGKPEYLRSDNGPEFSSAPFKEWLVRVGINPIQIYPGSPWENGYNERHLTPGSAEHRMVCHHQAGPDSRQSMAAPVQPYPAATRPRHATASPRNILSEPPNQWYQPRGLDNMASGATGYPNVLAALNAVDVQ